MKRSASLALLLLVPLLLPAAAGQSIIPTMELNSELTEVFVDTSSGPGTGVLNCTVAVEGLPMVRYRVNVTAEAGDWGASCEPDEFTFTGQTNESFKATVTVPAGERGGTYRQVNITAVVSTGGIEMNSTEVYCAAIVLQRYGVGLDSETTALPVDAGRTAGWGFEVQNTGNGRDMFSLSVQDTQSYTPDGWTFRFNRTMVSIDENASVRVTLNITPPETSPNQTVYVKVYVYSRGAKYEDENATVDDTLELALTVRGAPKNNGTGPPQPQGSPGAGWPAMALAAALAALVALRKRS